MLTRKTHTFLPPSIQSNTTKASFNSHRENTSFRITSSLRGPKTNRITPYNNYLKSFSTTKKTIMSEPGDKPGVTKSALEEPPEQTIFAKMARGEIEPEIVYQDESVLCFKDLNPQAPTHLLLIPKKLSIGQVHECEDNNAEELGKLFVAAGKVANKLDLGDGYRLVVNQGLKAQQSVNYLHVHLFSGRKLKWPPG